LAALSVRPGPIGAAEATETPVKIQEVATMSPKMNLRMSFSSPSPQHGA
jgi:hypothetical protein